MSRRVHFDNLRANDPVTLEIMLQEPLRRPLVQLSGATVSDMIALGAVESLPRPLHKQLLSFTERMSQEMTDLPDGEPIETLLGELAALPPGRVPEPLRAAVLREADPRPAVRHRIMALGETWSQSPPDAVVLGSGRPVIHRVKTALAEEPQQQRRPRAPAGTRPPREAEGPKPTRQAPVKLVDEERRKWLVQIVLERLADYQESGLREDVLVAGVRHRARAEYPDVTPNEVTQLLKELQEAGRVRASAGRWRRVIGSW